MVKDSALKELKIDYNSAKQIGNNIEAAACANKMGHVFKERGEYHEALRWFRLDLEHGEKLPESQRSEQLPSLQCLGETHLLLRDYNDALKYMVRHFEMAGQLKNLAEQQRASTQLARTYLEMYTNSPPDYDALPLARNMG
eukprot:jgi/Mesen1/5275/ME000263S04379